MTVPGAERMVAELRDRGLTLGTCESLTGGGIAAAITDVPGASAVLRGGLVTYASDLKVSLAGVDAVLVAEQGVINEPTARQMAQGARTALGCDLAVSCTGVAGPDPQDGELPGTVWIAVAEEHRTTTRRLGLTGDRGMIRHDTVVAAIELILDCLGGKGSGPFRED